MDKYTAGTEKIQTYFDGKWIIKFDTWGKYFFERWRKSYLMKKLEKTLTQSIIEHSDINVLTFETAEFTI